MWWWHKIRRANITSELRNRFELYGETALVLAMTTGDMSQSTQGPFLAGLVRRNHDDLIAWLRERRDVATRHEDRVETVEWAILVFVIIGVLADITIIFWR